MINPDMRCSRCVVGIAGWNQLATNWEEIVSGLSITQTETQQDQHDVRAKLGQVEDPEFLSRAESLEDIAIASSVIISTTVIEVENAAEAAKNIDCGQAPEGCPKMEFFRRAVARTLAEQKLALIQLELRKAEIEDQGNS
jgi:metal-sulfur cluster biosynthetic enzyme